MEIGGGRCYNVERVCPQKKMGAMPEDTVVRLGRFSGDGLEGLIQRASAFSDPGLRIRMISEEFLGIPYRGFTLVGDREIPERLVIDLEGMDCFTFLDYVEAIRLSRSADDFPHALIGVRYRGGAVAFDHRNHFFTDWALSPDRPVSDITGDIGGKWCARKSKRLNMKEDGSVFLPGLRIVEREISYVPAGRVEGPVEGRLRTGDYVGIYSLTEGLDVSHVGIFIRKGDACCLRHASSSGEQGKVIDQDFGSYIRGKPGIVVLRAYDMQ